MAPTWAVPGLFCFAQGSEISSVLNLRVLNLLQVVEQMN